MLRGSEDGDPLMLDADAAVMADAEAPAIPEAESPVILNGDIVTVSDQVPP